ncbi:exonuclease [uncultured Caudovirales phage]|uniref:Exonuclease n=1 Tax=uncultured Caudovirales phage TaxID=2100421 RepID=A0A6J5P0F2_9CAUD|nr:exonuclease [uncultured Caudovirales phage]
MSRVLLIDGDVLAYAAASKAEKTLEWEPGEFTVHANLEEAQANVESKLEQFQRDLDGDLIKIAMTDSVYWRKDVLSTYKSNRAATRKPIILKQVRQWMFDVLQAVSVPTLEGDDVLGIWATHPGVKGEKIIVSIDKDMKTIPGLVYNPSKDSDPVLISEAEADRWHMMQTLAGDTTDGYSGCPGIGMKRAGDILDAAGDDAWAAVVAAFAKAKLGPDEALVQARVARICRASDYDSKLKKVKLWEPNPRTATQ